jgi:hypothetical protein
VFFSVAPTIYFPDIFFCVNSSWSRTAISRHSHSSSYL